MRNIRLILSIYARLSVSNFMSAVEAILGAVNGNINFPTPVPSTMEIQSNLTSMRNFASEVDQGNLAAIPDRDQVRDTITAQIYQLAADCLSQAINSSTSREQAIVKIQSANFVVAGQRQPVGNLPAVQNLRSTSLSHAIELEWSGIYGAHAFSVTMTTQNPNDPTAVWTEVALTTRTKTTIEDLVPGQPLAFRVCALGSAGKGQPSDFVSAMASL